MIGGKKTWLVETLFLVRANWSFGHNELATILVTSSPCLYACMQGFSRLWGAAATLREVMSSLLPPAERDKQEREITAARERLGENAFAAAWAQGRTMTMEQAIEYALSEAGVTSS